MSLRTVLSLLDELLVRTAEVRKSVTAIEGVDLATLESRLVAVSAAGSNATVATAQLVSSHAEGAAAIDRSLGLLSRAASEASDLARTVAASSVEAAVQSVEATTKIREAARSTVLDLSELFSAVDQNHVALDQLLGTMGRGTTTVIAFRQTVSGVDFDPFLIQLTKMIQGLHEGTVDVERALELLGKSHVTYSQQLVRVIELFRQGKVSIKKVMDMVRTIDRAFPDSELADLAHALEEVLKKGSGR